MASLGGEQQILSNSQAAESGHRNDSREGSAERKVIKDRDEKLKLARERQNEERQRKIEELKIQAEAAQRYREQKDEERRRRIEEIRQRDCEKRQQVEERKRAIMEAEKERREYILKKNQERDYRLDTKKRERSTAVYAFGSSTPRLLEPADFGTVSPSTFWGQRRSTSVANVAGATLSRRSSERELNDSGSKKRAVSASGDGSRSGNVTPGGSNYTSRPGSAMSTSTTMSTSGFVTKRTSPAVRKPRPASIAGTGVSLEEMNKAKRDKPPMKNSTPPSALAQSTPKRTPNLMSTSLIVTSSSRLLSSEKKTPSKRESLANKGTSTPKSLSKTASVERLNKLPKEKPKDVASPITKSTIAASVAVSTDISAGTDKQENIDTTEATQTNVAPPASSTKEEKNALNAVKTDEAVNSQSPTQVAAVEIVPEIVPPVEITEEKVDQGSEKEQSEPETEVVDNKPQPRNGSKENSEARELSPPSQSDNDIMTASMIARNKITTEEEAKAALAERRRLAREEAERQAELERQRLEAERLAEERRQEEEAERQRQFEEESTRLAELQRKAEEERLRQAIEEAKQREEEERRKREEDERQRLEREEAEKRAKEEAEKQRIEVNERLKREEKEREERRKRVEAIMSRTRKSGAATTPNSTPVKENNDPAKNQTNHTEIPAQQSENAGSDSSSTSGSVTTATTPSPNPSQTSVASVEQPQNTQELYEQAVKEKETELLKNFSNMIIDENEKNRQQQMTEITNGKLHSDNILENSTTVANGNGHIENINNKNEINIRQDNVAPSANQLIDLSIESQDINNAVNLNNNNSLLSTTTLVTADSHDNKDLSLL